MKTLLMKMPTVCSECGKQLSAKWFGDRKDRQLTWFNVCSHCNHRHEIIDTDFMTE